MIKTYKKEIQIIKFFLIKKKYLHKKNFLKKYTLI
jgi:hypothetical protein